MLQCHPANAKDSICLHTLIAVTGPDEGPPFFEVTDLAEDERFAWLPFVVDNSIRYYYGAPLRTKRGVTIGTICVLDDKERAPLDAVQQACELDRSNPLVHYLLIIYTVMESIANNVTTHLSLLRQRAERRRALRMNRTLINFLKQSQASPEV